MTNDNTNSEPTVDQNCASCVFSNSAEDNPVRSCRRFPPQAVFTGRAEHPVISVFPVVKDDQVCGEFRAEE